MKPLLSRRRFCVSAALGPLLVAVPAVRAQTDPPAGVTADLPSATLYAFGLRMLREGRTFEKAAAHFETLCQREPKADYFVALGCAYASRAASLAWAGAFGERLPLETAAYREVVAWLAEKEVEMRQKIKEGKASSDEIKNFEEGLAAYKQNLKPPSIQVVLIKDDKTPYKQAHPELVAQLTELNRKALSAWEKAVALCQTPEEKANAQYVRGWGMRLLLLYLSDESRWRFHLTSKATRPSQFRYFKAEPLPLGIKGVPTDAQIKAALNEAAEGAPENALYLQAQADALAFAETGNPAAETTELYRKAAALEPKNANLWNRVYDRESAYRYAEKQADAPFAIDDLHRAQARDRANAWYGYEEAGRVLEGASWSRSDFLKSDATKKETDAAHDAPRTDAGFASGKRAVALMERANALPRFAPPVYQSSVPALLTQAWNYVPEYWGTGDNIASPTRFQNMSGRVRDYAESLATGKQNNGEAVRVLRILQQAGLRIMGDPWPVFDFVSVQSTHQLVWAIAGSTLVSSAFFGLLAVANKQNDSDALAAFTRERDEWDVRFNKWFSQMPGDYNPPVYQVYDRNR